VRQRDHHAIGACSERRYERSPLTDSQRKIRNKGATRIRRLRSGLAEHFHVHALIEADIEHGVIAVPLTSVAGVNTRICRPVGLEPQDCQRVCRYAIERLGLKYDLRNIIDLARYLLPVPPVPVYLRRRMLALGSGDPTRAICSTLIAQAFQSVRYPILPRIERQAPSDATARVYGVREILHIRHYSLFTPRDFDVSPYFKVIKPVIEVDFSYLALRWTDGPGAAIDMLGAPFPGGKT